VDNKVNQHSDDWLKDLIRQTPVAEPPAGIKDSIMLTIMHTEVSKKKIAMPLWFKAGIPAALTICLIIAFYVGFRQSPHPEFSLINAVQPLIEQAESFMSKTMTLEAPPSIQINDRILRYLVYGMVLLWAFSGLIWILERGKKSGQFKPSE